MNVARDLPKPLNSFQVDVPANTYYNFELTPNSTYPLKGVTYTVDYGNIPGYIAEDGQELDLFVGNASNGKLGSIVVDRGQTIPNERKFYVALTTEELNAVLKELDPVLVSHRTATDITELLTQIKEYKDRG